jgi:hypothetical protein
MNPTRQDHWERQERQELNRPGHPGCQSSRKLQVLNLCGVPTEVWFEKGRRLQVAVLLLFRSVESEVFMSAKSRADTRADIVTLELFTRDVGFRIDVRSTVQQCCINATATLPRIPDSSAS